MSRPKTTDRAGGAPPAELEHEQSYVTKLYERLDQLRERTWVRLQRAQSGETIAGGGTRQALVERDALVGTFADQLVRLSAVEHALALGRLDHRDGSRLYVGRIGLSDDDHEPLLVDWRAPAAQPFYRATPAAPGTVVRRRHLRTRGRTVIDFNDDVLDLAALSDTERDHLVGEAALLASLAAGRTGRMSDIVATIQAEQDRIIRADLPGILVVQGGPGTGKTAVALHRAAYLLYTHRERLGRRGVLVLGPNPTFLRYIEQVLPSLGETGVLLSTVHELYLGSKAPAAEPVEVATLKGDERMAGVLARAVADHQRVFDAPLDLPVANDDVLRLDPATVAHARATARASGQRHNQARLVFAGEIVAALARQQVDRMEKDFDLAKLGVDESLFGPDEQLFGGPMLDAEQLEDLRRELLKRPAVQSALDRLWPNLTPERLVSELFASEERLASAAADLSDADRALLRRDRHAPWTAADAPLLDEAAMLLGEDGAASAREAAKAAARDREAAYARGVLENVAQARPQGGLNAADVVDPKRLAERYADNGERATGIAERARGDRSWVFGHVIVDEAQELSAMAWRMIVRRCPSRSMTVVGDLAQTGAPGGASSWASVLEPNAPGRWREERLTVNYRTPSEIMAVAADVLAGFAPELEPPSSVRDGGDPPWHERVDEAALAERLPAIVAAETDVLGEGRLAVLVPEARAAELGERVTAALAAATPPVEVGVGGTRALDATVAVLTVTQVKGLEFDVVVLVDPDAILAESANGQRDLYVALSRATRRLGVVHTGPLPAILARLEHPGGRQPSG